MREERDPAWWAGIAAHPEVEQRVTGEVDWPLLVGSPVVLPLACEHGGYLFVRLDALGRVHDLHAAFEPGGWGKTASEALKAALRLLRGWDVICATEVSGNWRSRPPKSFGFRPASEAQGDYRTWILTRAAWESSPVRRRMG